MKFFHYVIIIVFLFVAVLLPHVVFGQSLTSKPDTLEDYFGNSTITHIDHGGASIIIKPIYNKTSFKIGEKIAIIPSLVNAGNKSISIFYVPLLFLYEIKDQNGNVVWLHLEDGGHVLEMPGATVILQPNLPHVATDKYIENMPVLYTPGKYDVLTMAYFQLGGSAHYTSLWSKPLQITVLPEKVPEFPFTIPVLLISVASLIVFTRLRFGKI